MAGAVLSEAALSFLGLGVPPPAPSWGVMIEEARDPSTLQAAPHALIFPGIAIALTVLAFNFIGDGLREYLDPRQRRRSLFACQIRARGIELFRHLFTKPRNKL